MMWPFTRKNKIVESPQNSLDPDTIPIQMFRQVDSEDLRNLNRPAPERLSREKALQYVPFARCVDLLSTQAADLVTMSLRVVNKEGKLIATDTAKKMLYLLQETPDGVQSAHNFISDVMSDYLIEGNSLIYARPGMAIGSEQTIPRLSLSRLNVSGANAMIADTEKGFHSLVYQTNEAGMGEEKSFPARHIIHAKWFSQASDISISGGNHQYFFSKSPLEFLSSAIRIGLAADAWVYDFFDSAAKNNLVIQFPVDADQASQRAFMRNYLRYQTTNRQPLLTFGGATVREISPNPQSADALRLREYQVQEIGRFYGVPAPLIGLHVTQWGSGIEQLARLMWRYGTRMHIKSLLDALSFRLLPRGQKFEVDITQEVKGDMNTMNSLISTVRPDTNTPGLMSLKEVRSLLGLYGDYENDWNWPPKEDEKNILEKNEKPLDKSEKMSDNVTNTKSGDPNDEKNDG